MTQLEQIIDDLWRVSSRLRDGLPDAEATKEVERLEDKIRALVATACAHREIQQTL
jgi:hypothetical protein